MKVLLMSLVIVLSGCDIAYEVLDEYYQEDMEGHSLYYSDEFEVLENIEDVSWYVVDNICYDIDKGYQNPEQTLNDKLGNCTSYAIAYVNVLYYVTGVKANVIFVDMSSRSVANGGFDANHAIVELPDGTQIEPQDGQSRHYEVLYRYGFDVVF